MTIRMASIEVLDYRKDGEVEARRVTGANIAERGRFSLWGALGSVHQPPPLSVERGAILAILDRRGELIRRRQFNLSSQTAASELAAAQIAAHSPPDKSVITISDAILPSRTAARRSA